MKHILQQIVLLLISSTCLASNYVVKTEVDQFIVYEDEPVLIEIIIKPKDTVWIIDESGRSNITKPECSESENELSTYIYAQTEGIGLKEIGPYQFSIGNETIETKPIRIYKIPRRDEPLDFSIISKKDPNGSNLFHIKIEYKIIKENGGIRVIEIDHKQLPEGVKLKSSSTGTSSGRVLCDITLKITANKKIVLTKENFIDIPTWVTFPEIIISDKINAN